MAKYDSYHDTVATILYIAIYCDAIGTAKYFFKCFICRKTVSTTLGYQILNKGIYICREEKKNKIK